MDAAIILIQLLSVISSFGVIAMTYHVYTLSHRNTQADNYLKQIIYLYYKIKETSKLLNSANLNILSEKAHDYYFNEIRVDCTLMIYYFERYPGFYGNRTKFVYLLKDIIEHPENNANYDYLSNAFSDFCQNIKKDSKGEKYHLILNGREDGYPEKDF